MLLEPHEVYSNHPLHVLSSTFIRQGKDYITGTLYRMSESLS
jgi:hypothetical protein